MVNKTKKSFILAAVLLFLIIGVLWLNNQKNIEITLRNNPLLEGKLVASIQEDSEENTFFLVIQNNSYNEVFVTESGSLDFFLDGDWSKIPFPENYVSADGLIFIPSQSSKVVFAISRDLLDLQAGLYRMRVGIGLAPGEVTHDVFAEFVL